MAARWVTVTLVVVGTVLAFRAWGQDASVEAMTQRADEILKMGNVAAREHIEEVMLLAGRLAKDGKMEDAAKYYEAGLKCYPLDLKHQLACAELYVKMGEKDSALAKARIVAKLAEEDELVVPALKIMGEKTDTKIEPMGKLDGDAFKIVLAPMGDVDVLFLRAVQKKVQEQLGITILIRGIGLKMPKFGRDPLHDFCQVLRKWLMKVKENSADSFAALLKDAAVAESDLDQDTVLLAMVQSMTSKSEGDDAAKAFAKRVNELSVMDKQWDSDELLQVLRGATAPFKQKNVRFIGVTRCDIYSDDTAFLFANGYMGETMVVSYRRFMSSFTGEPPTRDRFLKRAVNQTLSSCGKVLGIDSCSDPTCPRAYPHSVAEQDAKGDKLCDKCKKAFDDALGRKAAPTSNPAK